MPIPAQRPIRERLPSWSVSALALLLAFQMATPAWAWGRLGHRLTARIAERHLTPKAKAAIAALLDPGESLADASTWADENRRRIAGSGPWHYVNIPIDQDSYDERLIDDRHASIVPKFKEFRAILEDSTRPVEERRLALRFIVHLVGDVHQPLHVGDNGDAGGNRTQVRFFTRGSNLHSVWESGIIEHAGRDEDRWLAELAALDTDANRADTLRGTVEFWATESLREARGAYSDPGTGMRIESGQTLADAYQEANLPVVRRRIYQGGVRLAQVLNETFSDN